MSILKSILAAIGLGPSRAVLSQRFVEQFLLPDMVENDFGFGRAAVGNALIAMQKTSFDEVFALTPVELERIRNSRGVGAKVYTGFLKYLARRGVLISADQAGITVVETVVAAEQTAQGVSACQPESDQTATA